MIAVTLTGIELEITRLVGKTRHNVSKGNGLKDAHGLGGKTMHIDISGAGGELAVAKLLNIYWPAGINTFHDADIAENIQVRTATQDNHSLIYRKVDNPQHAYVLVIDHSPVFNIVGWMWGYECQKDVYWKAYNGRPGAWFVPPKNLRDISVLALKYHWNGRGENK